MGGAIDSSPYEAEPLAAENRLKICVICGWILFFGGSFKSVVSHGVLFDRSGGNTADQLPREDEIE
jgi:hypothetical protein